MKLKVYKNRNMYDEFTASIDIDVTDEQIQVIANSAKARDGYIAAIKKALKTAFVKNGKIHFTE